MKHNSSPRYFSWKLIFAQFCFTQKLIRPILWQGWWYECRSKTFLLISLNLFCVDDICHESAYEVEILPIDNYWSLLKIYSDQTVDAGKVRQWIMHFNCSNNNVCDEPNLGQWNIGKYSSCILTTSILLIKKWNNSILQLNISFIQWCYYVVACIH